MEIKNLPDKFQILWKKVVPLLKKGRPDDLEHAKEVVEFILEYKGNFKLDYDIMIPMAMMHDIGHSAILPEHFKLVTGPEKIPNAKLVHMLIGAKIAHDILKSIKYDPEKIKEIVEMISVHDADQLDNIDLKKFYNTENKKIFHDIDAMDRYTETRFKNTFQLYKDKNKMLTMLRDALKVFIYPEFKQEAERRMVELEKKF